jgi:hypothetical protein
MMALEPGEMRRLIGALALLGSPVAGERDAAGLAAHRIISGRGLRWEDLLAPDAGAAWVDYGHATGWRGDVALCARHPSDLRKWEAEFIASMQSRLRATLKQIACAADIASRLRTRGRK